MYLMNWIFAGSVVILSVLVISFCMLQVVHFVRTRLRVMKRRFSFANRTISTCANLEKQYRAVTKQALLYVVAFLLVWFFGFLFRVSDGTRNPTFLIPAQLLNPLQGFFNFFIYTWPRYAKSKEENPGMSFWWLIKDAIVTRTKDKVARRRLSDVQQRIMKKRRSIERRSSLRPDAHAAHRSEQASPIENMNYTSSMTESPTIAVVETFVYEEEPITRLQSLQRLDDCQRDEPMTFLHDEFELFDEGDGDGDWHENSDLILMNHSALLGGSNN